jgi:ribosomal protection tetracycline resistance protein
MPAAFFTAVEETVHAVLERGRVTDCAVTMTHSGYWARQSHAHQGFNKAFSSTAGDFRDLTPMVLRTALRRAGTQVLEPVHRFTLELPADTLGPVLPAIAQLGGVPGAPVLEGETATLEGIVPAARVHDLRTRLPGLTRGEALLESAFDRYEPVSGRRGR